MAMVEWQATFVFLMLKIKGLSCVSWCFLHPHLSFRSLVYKKGLCLAP